jgi:hypothetical protein
MVLGALSSGVNWPEREADQPRPPSVEVNNVGAIATLPNTSSWRDA